MADSFMSQKSWREDIITCTKAEAIEKLKEFEATLLEVDDKVKPSVSLGWTARSKVSDNTQASDLPSFPSLLLLSLQCNACCVVCAVCACVVHQCNTLRTTPCSACTMPRMRNWQERQAKFEQMAKIHSDCSSAKRGGCEWS